jgi:starch synthase
MVKQALVGAPDAAFTIDGVEFYNQVSFLKSGLVYADHLTTVSATYAREITTPQFGCRLEGLLQKRARADQLTGILNGIDETWDPRNCPDLEMPFGAGDWQHKRANTNQIQPPRGSLTPLAQILSPIRRQLRPPSLASSSSAALGPLLPAV